jgi:geranylgeranyl pyrophosphate synthase
LDFTGEQSEVGKPVGSDLLQGLVTLPAIYYAEAHPDDPDIICLGNGCYSEPERMERLVQATRKSDGVERSLQEAEGFIQKALKALAEMPAGVERDALKELARYTVNRRS